MKQIRFTLSAMAFVLSLQASAPETAAFSGVWRMDLSRSDSAHQAVPIGPVTLIIKQNSDEVSIETRRAQKGKPAIYSETLTFKLDGSENTITGSNGTPVQVKAH